MRHAIIIIVGMVVGVFIAEYFVIGPLMKKKPESNHKSNTVGDSLGRRGILPMRGLTITGTPGVAITGRTGRNWTMLDSVWINWNYFPDDTTIRYTTPSGIVLIRITKHKIRISK